MVRIKDLVKDSSLPICHVCNILMEIHKTMTGDQYICENYFMCGSHIPVEKWKQENGTNNKYKEK